MDFKSRVIDGDGLTDLDVRVIVDPKERLGLLKNAGCTAEHRSHEEVAAIFDRFVDDVSARGRVLLSKTR